ncbi:hypothetical protein AUC43_13045 [Hymenobacter sedentarius]|uniref:Glycosyltransferase RgtA/B/C/D-like domain-containing protein n=1 Tax=Hymenobacter sedentarius TaxID=1411621 RepID=A0A0U4AQZ4_9BACT|nr:hypothetical protein [Hymenobacter sedentarius]ALW85941.1 hypothetical protein AUC43_13045 [Hymenobacter sedentarius]
MGQIFSSLRAALATLWRPLVVLLLYAVYLPFSGYTPGQFKFDAAEYWELSLKFTQQGHFSLLAFDEPLRGYLGPLLILPARVLCHVTGWPMLAGARVLGAGWAALLFGLAIPQLWAQVARRPLSVARWFGLVGLGFIFWRDYFNFTLSDMPALTLLLLGLAALGWRSWAWAGVAGLLLAAAINIRPIYVASVPACLWLLYALPRPSQQLWRRTASLVAGAALVLLPQWLINQRYFQQPTPLVLAGLPSSRPLYLKQLGWGTSFQRYESSLISEIPRSLVFADPAGQRAMANMPGRSFTSYGQYLKFVVRQPLAVGWRYLRHLFNGLDIRFPTPYPTQLHPPGQAALRLLNYALLGLGACLAVVGLRRSGRPQFDTDSVPAAVMVALLLPCLLVLPTLMECRFLLPLHLLALTGVAACWQPVRWWRTLGSPLRRVAVLGLALGWLWGCWQLSESTAQQLRPPSEAPQE